MTRPSRTVPLIVATALFMQNMDASVLSTSLPAIAADLKANPIHLKLALTSYLLAMAVFIPASGWVADRFGARMVFRLAIVAFALGSLACGLAQSLPQLVAARIFQGIGGAMMMPVGRLIVLRSVPRHDFVGAIAWLTMPALLGPVVGPPLGGFLTTFVDWRWIFWINLPIAALGFVLVSVFIPDIRETERRPFDLAGFLLVGPGLAASLTGITLAGLGLVRPWLLILLIGGGTILLVAYVRYARRATNPILDLTLLKLPTFRAAVSGGTLFRIGAGGTPFLLPLLLQLGFGLSAFQSGLLTFATGAGAMAMKLMAQPILTRFGFRRVLMVNAAIASVFLAVPALFAPTTPVLVMVALLFVGGLSRSLQFTALNAVGYADVPPGRLSNASSFVASLQELSGSVGVTVAALALEAMVWRAGTSLPAAGDFPVAMLVAAGVALLSVLSFAALPKDAGQGLLTSKADRQSGES
jgi:EmrB/QacA subfamily drug resistance transporter